ncbi:MAG: SPFH domain-containing protein [Thioalkalispiraceae bacterium]|jgi:hypothetical protein
MHYLIIAIVLLAVFFYLLKNPIRDSHIITRSIQSALFLAVLFFLTLPSYVIIDADEVGLMKRKFLAAKLPPGQIIAADGEKGPQAEILGPGFNFSPFIRILNDIEYTPVIEIPEGHYGILKAQDGRPMRENQFIADPWPENKVEEMLDAKFFLTEGKGQKGPQLQILRPGKYRLNTYLFKVKIAKALDVPAGHVAVIRSKVQERDDCPNENAQIQIENQVSAIIVPKGCKGVHATPLNPQAYYLNREAYEATIIPTRIQTWSYKGGYIKRQIDLNVDNNGKIQQVETAKEEPVTEDAADRAIIVRVEGWTVPVDVRIVVQVNPENAPLVVASVGDLQKVEDKIITPAIRNIFRTIGGHADRKVMDFIEKREEINQLVHEEIARIAAKAGVTVQEVHMGEPAIPPELMVATLREQLASQLKETYIREQEAQKQRISVERERATADQQAQLVKAEIAKNAAAYKKQQLKLEGEGEKLKLMEIAKGQQAQANVLGKDRAMQLQALEMSLAAAVQNPDIVKIPTVQVTGTGSGYEGAAAVLGASNLIESMKGMSAKQSK